MKLGVLGVLSNLHRQYSIAGVVIDQLHMLKRAGHDVVFITTSDFQDSDKLPDGVTVRTYDRYHGPLNPVDKGAFDEYVQRTKTTLVECLSDRDVCLTHDVLFLRDFVP